MSSKHGRTLASTATSYQIQRAAFHLLDPKVGCIKAEWDPAGVRGKKRGLSAVIQPAVVGIWESVLVTLLVAMTK